MDAVKVIITNLPHSVRGLTVYHFAEGQVYYTIFINARLCSQMQQAAYEHEIEHIKNNDFERIISADKLER